MADNYVIKDGDGHSQTFAAKDVAGIKIPRSVPTAEDGTTIAVATSTKQDAQSTLIGAVTETTPGSDTGSSGLNGRLQRIAQRLTSLIALIPAALGQTTKSGSFAVTVASDDDLQGKLGALTETAPASDTASSGLNGRLQRVAQRLTSLIALLPTSLGAKAASASLAVTQSTEDAAQLGSLTETAPGTDTASSGLNGRLQRIAQRITSLIALVPAALTGSGNFKVAINEAIAAGTAVIGGMFGSTSAASGGVASIARLVSAASGTNGAFAKSSAGRAYFAFGHNAAASVRYLKLYNKASAPTVGTDTPVMTLALPPSAGFAFDFAAGIGLYFSTGIAYALTTGSADSDTGSLTAGDITGLNIGYA